MNDCYPEEQKHSVEELRAVSLSYEDYLYGIENRGFDTFSAGDRQLIVDTTDFSKVDMEQIFSQVMEWSSRL